MLAGITLTLMTAIQLAHNPVTSHYISGAVRFPVDLRLYRRYEEFTHWEQFVLRHFPGTTIPKKKKERQNCISKWMKPCCKTLNSWNCTSRFAPKLTWR